MSAAIARAIRRRSKIYVVERREPVTTDPLSGRGSGGTQSATIRAHIQPAAGPRRVDGVDGVDTAGTIKIWVAAVDTVVLDEGAEAAGELLCDEGEGSSAPPGDVIQYDGHRWLVVERSNWVEEGSHRQYLARDEGPVP